MTVTVTFHLPDSCASFKSNRRPFIYSICKCICGSFILSNFSESECVDVTVTLSCDRTGKNSYSQLMQA